MDCADHGITEMAQLSNFHFPDRRVPKAVCRLLCGTGHIAVVILEKQSSNLHCSHVNSHFLYMQNTLISFL